MALLYPLQDIVMIREKRQDLAQLDVIRAQHALEQAKRDVIERKKELEEYQKWVVEEEDRRFKGVIGKKMLHPDLLEFKADISKLRDSVAAYQERFAQAEQAVLDREEDLVKAKAHLLQTIRELEKMVEHKKSWSEEAQREETLLEDKELEEFATKHEYTF
jgi:hypothetical protein